MFVPGVVWFFSLSASLGLLANLPYFILNHQKPQYSSMLFNYLINTICKIILH